MKLGLNTQEKEAVSEKTVDSDIEPGEDIIVQKEMIEQRTPEKEFMPPEIVQPYSTVKKNNNILRKGKKKSTEKTNTLRTLLLYWSLQYKKCVNMECCSVFLLVIAIAILIIFKRSFSYWKKKGVYAPTPSFPFGNAKNAIMQKCCIGIELKDVYNHFKERSLSFGGYYFLTTPIFIPVDLNVIKKILITDFNHFTNRSYFSQKYDPLSQHLFALKGAEWKIMRSKLTPAFTTSKNKMLFETVLMCVKDLIILLDNASEMNEKIEIKNLSSRLAIDVIALCVFGIEADSIKNPNSKIKKNVTEYFHPSPRNAFMLLLALINPKILSFFKIKMTSKNVSDFFMNLMETTVNYRETNNLIRKDFIHLLLQIKNNSKINDDAVGGFQGTDLAPQLTIEEMAAQCLVFFIGGFETVSCTITYCLYELAKNTAIQKKARAEVRKCFVENSENDQLTYALLQKMCYINKVVYETLRLYPPAATLLRECSKDYIIPNTNVRIEKGCSVLVPTLGIHRDPDLYPNPDEFDPERFSPENIKNRHACAWIPFGEGPRNCIAYQFGLMEIKIVLATLLNRYQFTINSETQQPLIPSSKTILLLPSNKVWLNFERL
ncbi:hypothetical protein RN001_015155 [Aquatica leii]|uniref:Cytochrome P450 n=1 Tax=Aquatica leii TaxID=1421715 RepID=A0AAN7P2Z3_9COLE|nr:hypothetical protein RN001_015155 [Aquatica leii]